MGYTHYFRRDFSQASNSSSSYDAFTDGVKNIVKHADVPVDVSITENYVRVNGVGADGHEDFYWTKLADTGFNFCKTAEKPYDAVVTACLLWLKECYGEAVTISSDGYWHEWLPGRRLFAEAFDYNAEFPFVEEKVVS